MQEEINTNTDNTNQPIDFSKLTQEQVDEYIQQALNSIGDVDTSDPHAVLEYLQKNYMADVPSIDRPSKLIACPHEIVFTIIANVLEENEKGETIGTAEICQKNYHIPVPPEHDYNIYMDSFFKYLENCIQSSAKHATKQSEKTNE